MPTERSRDVVALGACRLATGLDGLDARARNTGCLRQLSHSRRRRASSIVGSTPRSRGACLLSSRTARTTSATRSAGTLPCRSADRVAVITVDNALLSFVMGRITGACECGSPDNGGRPPPKVVAGVVERMGVRTPRRAQSCRSDRSPGGWVLLPGRLRWQGGPGRTCDLNPVWGGGVSGWVPEGGSVGEPACVSGRHGQLLGFGGSLAAAMFQGGQPVRRPRGWARTGQTDSLQVGSRRCGCSTDASAPGNTSASCPSPRRTRYGGAPSRPRISMISDVWSDVPTTRPCTCNRSPTTARMTTPPEGSIQQPTHPFAEEGRAFPGADPGPPPTLNRQRAG